MPLTPAPMTITRNLRGLNAGWRDAQYITPRSCGGNADRHTLFSGVYASIAEKCRTGLVGVEQKSRRHGRKPQPLAEIPPLVLRLLFHVT
jgi:hypothetical protein